MSMLFVLQLLSVSVSWKPAAAQTENASILAPFVMEPFGSWYVFSHVHPNTLLNDFAGTHQMVLGHLTALYWARIKKVI